VQLLFVIINVGAVEQAMNNAAAWRCGGIDTPLGRSGLQHARSLARSGPSFQQAERTAVQTTTL